MNPTLNNPRLRGDKQGVEEGSQAHYPRPKRICFRACSHLPCSIQGYRISSLDVIERWSLCYHLGCAVTSLAKVGLEQSNKSALENWMIEQARLEDLKKAEWYLARELSLPQKCHLAAIGEQPFTTEAVLEDWQLSSSFHLSEALYHIKASKSPSMREESLREALKHLSAEIAAEIQTLKGGINATANKQAHCFEVFKHFPAKVEEPDPTPSEDGENRMEQLVEQTTNEEKGGNE